MWAIVFLFSLSCEYTWFFILFSIHTPLKAHVELRGQLSGVGSFFYYVGSQDWTQGIASRNPKHLGTQKPASDDGLFRDKSKKQSMDFLFTSCLPYIENTSPVHLAKDDVSLWRQKKSFDLISKKCLENSGIPLSKLSSIWRKCHETACLLARSLWA